MSFFESLLALMLAAIFFLQVSRRLAIPYPAMLAAAGVMLALIPGTPSIRLDPHTALALSLRRRWSMPLTIFRSARCGNYGGPCSRWLSSRCC